MLHLPTTVDIMYSHTVASASTLLCPLHSVTLPSQMEFSGFFQSAEMLSFPLPRDPDTRCIKDDIFLLLGSSISQM